jgi:outer membrane receptor protein involved in Fe transport
MRRHLAVLAALLLLAMTAAAQTTATIAGMVRDEGGNMFPGATITATNTASGFTHTTTAGNDGRFTLAGLPAANYRLDVTAPSYKGSSREVRVLVGQTLELDFRLTPDLVLMEQITVVGTTAVETETSEIATNITPRQMESLPQSDRNFLNFAALAPGVTLGTDEMRKEIRGGAQSSSATNVFIDGVSFKNDVIQGGVVGQDASRGNPFPQNAVQEFRVITQNYSAEYQKASSAIITAVTKSGSNQLSGDAFYHFQNKGLVAEHPMRHTNPEYERSQYGLSVGGPIIRDRMHFFASYEANDQDRESSVRLANGWESVPSVRTMLATHAGTFVSPFRSDLAFGKISFQPGPAQLFDWSGNWRKETDVRSFGDQTAYEAAENVRNDVWGTTLRHQYTANSWLNELSVSYQDFQWNPTPLDSSSVGFVYEGVPGNLVLRFGGRDTEQDIGQQRLSLRDDVTLTNLKLGFGQHNVKVGGNLDFLDYTVTKYFEENPRFFFREGIFANSDTIPYKARFGFGNPDMSSENTQFGIYGQDDWAVNDRLTLNLGLRWDYETEMFDTGYVTPAVLRQRLSDDFPARFFSTGSEREPKTDMFQPRLGFSYDGTGAAMTIDWCGAGRYYDLQLYNLTLDEKFRLQHFVGDVYFSPNGTDRVLGFSTVKWDPKYLDPANLRQLQAQGLAKPEVFLIANDLDVPYSDQWNLGVRQSFGGMVASGSYARIRSYNNVSFVIGKGNWGEVDPAYSNVFTTDDDVRTWYDAVYLTLDRPYTDQSRFGFNVAYTYADAEQIGGDLFSFDRRRVADYARYGTPGTSDHRIVASGIFGLPWQTRFSTLVQYSSGDKFRVHDYPNGFCGDNNCYVPRTGEGPSWTSVDLRFDKDFSVRGPYRVGIVAEAFNIFNEERYTAFNDWGVNNPDEGKPGDIVTGSQRRFQFGVRVGF